jgi:hypothetical protein
LHGQIFKIFELAIDLTSFVFPICIGNANFFIFFALIRRVFFPQFPLATLIFYIFCVGNASFFFASIWQFFFSTGELAMQIFYFVLIGIVCFFFFAWIWWVFFPQSALAMQIFYIFCIGKSNF